MKNIFEIVLSYFFQFALIIVGLFLLTQPKQGGLADVGRIIPFILAISSFIIAFALRIAYKSISKKKAGFAISLLISFISILLSILFIRILAI